MWDGGGSAPSGEAVLERDGAPAGVLATKLQDAGLEPRRHLVWDVFRTVRPVGERLEATGPVARHPPVQALAADPVLLCRFAHSQTISDDRDDGVIALFHFAELLEHSGHLLPLGKGRTVGLRCQSVSRYSVTDQPLLCSRSGIIEMIQIRRGNTRL
jgi:hypothetical protein